MTKVKDIKKTAIISPAGKKQIIQEIYQQPQEIEPPKIVKRFSFNFKLTLLVLLVSLLGGFLAGFIQDSWFEAPYQSLPSPQVEDKQPEILDLDFLLKEEESAYTKILSELRGQVVGFYKKREGQGIFDSLYLEKDFLGSGLVITSDGWLLTHYSVIQGKDKDYVVVLNNKKILTPQKEVIDNFTNIALVKIEAENLSPARFADLNAIQPTDFLLTIRYSPQNHGSDIIKTSIQKFTYHDQVKGADFLLSTEKADHYLKVAKEFEILYNGSALLNSRNEIVGLLFNSGKQFINLAIPAYYLKSAVNNFLVKSEEVIRSSLGVSYIDLSESVGLPKEVTEGRLKGAVLLGDAKRNILAIAEDSPAEEAGLKAGDIVLKVNNEDVDERNSLTKLIQDYTPGQEVTLTILRAGEEMKIKVVLGEL